MVKLILDAIGGDLLKKGTRAGRQGSAYLAFRRGTPMASRACRRVASF